MGIKNGCNGKFKLLRSHWVEMVEVLSIKTFAAELCVWQSAVICSLAQDTMFGGIISTSLRLSDALLQDCARGKNAREFNPWDVNGFRIGQENQEYIAYKNLLVKSVFLNFTCSEGVFFNLFNYKRK